jgi:hypothetical protein
MWIGWRLQKYIMSFRGETPEKLPLQRPMMKCKDNIRIVLKETGYEGRSGSGLCSMGEGGGGGRGWYQHSLLCPLLKANENSVRIKHMN